MHDPLLSPARDGSAKRYFVFDEFANYEFCLEAALKKVEVKKVSL
jgi:hypothetical protein